MLNLFAKVLDPEKILDIQNLQYSEKILLEDTVPASSTKLGKVNISSLGHFYCIYITGRYTTLEALVQDAADNGINYLRGKLIDGSNQRQLFSAYIPLDLFLTPGRVKSIAVPAAAAGNDLFYPQPFQYMFTVNSDILFDVKNDSDWLNTYSLCFHGIRFPASQQDKRAIMKGQKAS